MEEVFVVLWSEDSYVATNCVKAFKKSDEAEKFVKECGGCRSSDDCYYVEAVPLE